MLVHVKIAFSIILRSVIARVFARLFAGLPKRTIFVVLGAAIAQSIIFHLPDAANTAAINRAAMIDESLLIPVNLLKVMGDRRSFVSGEPESDRLRVSYFKRIDNNTLAAKVWFGPGAEGLPGLAHGGSVAAALDEAMNFAAWAAGYAVLGVRTVTNFKQMLPLNTTATVETTVTAVDATKIGVQCRLLADNGTVFAEAEGMFLSIPSAKFGVDAKKVADMFTALTQP